ncbi:SAM-dependent methyltransferase [Nocardiopsis salina]|uniref:SAM-dependent methyltransferase n=1 Tax=Nocardiopsis salina TaxID=245836 RepID=UPI0003465B02|nr:SAM-dependent methyltransferase [Nocardiopsis salina]
MNSPPPFEVDTSQAHSARIWNYWLGGKDHYPPDREAGDRIAAALPEIVDVAVATRAVLARMVTHLVEEQGIDQFLDIGTGLPTADNTHEVAQTADPAARVVYVDNDPLVLTHARALLTGTPEGATDYVHADLRDPDTLLAEAARTLDPTRPVAVTMFGVLPFVGEDGEAKAIIDHLMGALPSGSFLAIVHSTSAVTGEAMEEAVRRWNEAGSAVYHLRTPERIAGLFEGLELVEPGVVSCPLWRAEQVEAGRVRQMDEFCGLGRK